MMIDTCSWCVALARHDPQGSCRLPLFFQPRQCLSQKTTKVAKTGKSESRGEGVKGPSFVLDTRTRVITSAEQRCDRRWTLPRVLLLMLAVILDW